MKELIQEKVVKIRADKKAMKKSEQPEQGRLQYSVQVQKSNLRHLHLSWACTKGVPYSRVERFTYDPPKWSRIMATPEWLEEAKAHVAQSVR